MLEYVERQEDDCPMDTTIEDEYEIQIDSKTLKVTKQLLSSLVALSVWPIKTYKTKEKKGLLVTIMFFEQNKLVEKSMTFQTEKERDKFMDQMFKAVEE
jgi:hypothetical protein